LMIFKQIAEVLSGRKTMTQRIVQDGEMCTYSCGEVLTRHPSMNVIDGHLQSAPCPAFQVPEGRQIMSVLGKSGRWTVRVGGINGIVPKRGQKGVRYIRVTSIQQPHVQEMRLLHAIAEGVNRVGEYQRLWDTINDSKGKRWADNTKVWRYRF